LKTNLDTLEGYSSGKLIVFQFFRIESDQSRWIEKPQSGHSVSMTKDHVPSQLAGVFKAAGFGPDDVPTKRSHTDYSSRVFELEPTFRVLSQPKRPSGTIPRLAKASHIPAPTIRHWRECLLADDSWRPGERYGRGNRLLTDEEERRLAATIHDDYIAPKT
jgi:hypothetical protein